MSTERLSYRISNSTLYWRTKRTGGTTFCSKKCQTEYSVGVNHPMYIHDRLKVKDRNKSIRWSKSMKDWRAMVYERDDFTCKMCNARSGINNPVALNAHHIKTFDSRKDLRLEISNGITLCESCHKATYWKEKQFEGAFVAINKKHGPQWSKGEV